MTTFEEWLRQLRAAGKLAPNGINIDRGLPFAWTFALGGDWTGATIASSLRLDPDAAGATVEDFTCSNDGYDADADATEFTLALTDAETAALIADTDGDALVQLAWDVVFTPSGGDTMRLMGGIATVTGKVTNG
ncbi:hypothetical protein ACWPMX_07740 [Tsuneonella sp. HG094]